VIFFRISLYRGVALAALLCTVQAARAEYRQIQLKVFGLDCELCARGVSASIHRMPGVKRANVSLKTGVLSMELVPGNTFTMSDLRKRIRESGFRPMGATVTAVGRFWDGRFEVLGTGESYDISAPQLKDVKSTELTFDIH
jgi:copper chaperone CopZ